jgi:EmrB/QacA subfamily drug resistance transporter
MKFLFKNKRNFLILIILVLSNSMVFLDATILPVALPKIQSMFHSTSSQIQWMVNSYILAMAVFLVAGGKIADIFGRRKIFCIGMGLFGISSLFCGFSYTSWQLIGSRFMQGIGAAMMSPASIGLLCESFSEKERYTVIGILGSVGSIFLTLGPVIGGYLTQYLSWHYIFFINVPISIIAIIFTLIIIAKSPKLKEPFDIYGFLSFGFGLFFLTVALMQAKSWGWGSIAIIVLFTFSLISFILLYLSDKKVKAPFIDFKLFKTSLFSCSLIIYTSISIARMITVFWVIYYQNILGFSPFLAGIIVAISVCPMIFLSPLTGFFVEKFGIKKPVIFGQFLLIFSYVWLAIFMIQGNIYILMPGLIIYGLGTVLVSNISYSTAINSVSVAKSAVAASIITTFRNAGSCLGVAVLGSVLTNVQFSKFSSTLSQIAPKSNPKLLEGLLSGSSRSIEALKALPEQVQAQAKEALSFSYSLGISIANIVASVIIVIGLLTIFTLGKIKIKKGKMIPSSEP